MNEQEGDDRVPEGAVRADGLGDVTQALRRLRAGEVGADEQLMRLVHAHLRRIAGSQLRRESGDRDLAVVAHCLHQQLVGFLEALGRSDVIGRVVEDRVDVGQIDERLFGLTCVLLWSLKRRQLVLFGLLWFGLALAPVSQIMPHHVHRAERFLYLPLVGLAITVAMGLHGLQIEKQAAEIRQNLKKLNSSFADFGGTWDILGKHLRNAYGQYDEGQKNLTQFQIQLEQIQGE